MKHMSHPDEPDVKVEAPEGRAEQLEAAGWEYLSPGPDKDDSKKS